MKPYPCSGWRSQDQGDLVGLLRSRWLPPNGLSLGGCPMRPNSCRATTRPGGSPSLAVEKSNGKEAIMRQWNNNRRGLRVAMLIGTFGVGFLCGSLSQRGADAQLKELGGAAMQQAGESGG